MVFLVLTWNILPDRVKQYNDWVKKTGTPFWKRYEGIRELRGYRNALNPLQAIAIVEFDSQAKLEQLLKSEEYAKVIEQAQTMTCNWTQQLWVKSPLLPKRFTG